MYVADEDNYKIETEDYNDNTEQPKKKKRNNKQIIRIIKVIIVAIIIGLAVYFISSLFFNKKQTVKNETEKQTLDIKSSEVKELYSYVTYGPNELRNDKFIKNKNVKLENFSNYDKFYYALQFATEKDFIKNKDDNTYSIDRDTLNLYMKKFFGSKITYEKESISIPIIFNFKIDNNNKVVLSYDKAIDGYKGVFSSYIETTDNNIIKPYYYELSSATKEEDNTITLKEKIIYLTKEEIKDPQGNSTNTYNYNIYKDYEHTILIEKFENVTKEALEEKPISVSDYKKKATTITYKFKYSQPDGYYFYSSKIDN